MTTARPRFIPSMVVKQQLLYHVAVNVTAETVSD